MSRAPLDQKLYDEVVAEAKRRFRVWPSAYASGWVVRTYKERGGQYAGEKKGRWSGLTKWYGETWVDLSRPLIDAQGRLQGYEKCGRQASREQKDSRDYPKCRPYLEAMRMSPDEVASAIRRKRTAESKASPSGRGRAPVRSATYKENPEEGWYTLVEDRDGRPVAIESDAGDDVELDGRSASGVYTKVVFDAAGTFAYAFTRKPAYDKLLMAQAKLALPDNPHLPSLELLGAGHVPEGGEYRTRALFRLPIYQAADDIQEVLWPVRGEPKKLAEARRTSSVLFELLSQRLYVVPSSGAREIRDFAALLMEEAKAPSRLLRSAAQKARVEVPLAEVESLAKALVAIYEASLAMTRKVRAERRNGEARLDLHDGNYALDSQNRLVLLDPVAWMPSVYKRIESF